MPNRIIRESALTSCSLAALSDGAERLFWRLTVVADDHGRFCADPLVVKARCFPLRVDSMKTQIVSLMLQELEDARIIVRYQSQDREGTFGYFANWFKHQRKRDTKSKFPEPLPQSAASCGDLPPYPREERRDKREEISETRRERRRLTQTSFPDDFKVTDELREWANAHQFRSPDVLLDAFRDHHISKGSRFADWGRAFQTWIRNDTEKYGAKQNGGVNVKPSEPKGFASLREALSKSSGVRAIVGAPVSRASQGRD